MTENKPIIYYKKDCFNEPYCSLKEVIEELSRKTQECEELREYHNKCCEEFENEKKELLEKYNQLSRDFYSGKYCNVEKCKQLDQLKVTNEQAEQKLERIREMATALCYKVMSDGVVILQEDILQIIDEVE